MAKKFKVTPATISYICSCQNFILDDSWCGKAKRIKSQHLECAILTLIAQLREHGLPVSGEIIQQKALTFARKLDMHDFTASNGWLEKFKKRNNMTFRRITGEGTSVDLVRVTDWKQTITEILGNYTEDNIYNADETALFFKCLPDRTYAFKGDKCIGGKHSKERITIMLGSNMSGTHKLTPLVIGKNKSPRCFKNVKSLPVLYNHNKKAWMNSELFQWWLTKIDEEFHLENRKVIMFVDNCPAHVKKLSVTLQSIKLIFFPPNMTSHVQPLDLGVIKMFKHYYRRSLVLKKIEEIRTDNWTSITLLDALFHINDSWRNHVTTDIITKCFLRAGFHTAQSLEITEMQQEESADRLNGWDALQKFANFDASFSEYVAIDDEVTVEGLLDDSQIIDMVQSNSVEDNDSDDQNGSIPREKPTKDEQKYAFQIIENLLVTSEDLPNEMFVCLSTLQHYFMNKC